jgi:hypothetical protein
MRVFRVTVRGQFAELSDSARAWLRGAATDHDVFRSSFTEEGTFTYGPDLRFFNLRYEIRRVDGDEAEARTAALTEAERFLATLKLGHKGLRAASMDMTAMTDR